MVNPEYVGVSRADLDPRIVETFERYVNKAETALQEGRFGVRYGLVDEKLEVLIAEPRLPDFNEIFFGRGDIRDLASQVQHPALRLVSSKLLETETCAQLSQEPVDELLEAGYRADRAQSIINGGAIQNYVMVFDPVLGAVVQFDATPWFYKAGNLYEPNKILERKDRPREREVNFMPDLSYILSLRRQQDGSFTDGYITGGFFVGQTPCYHLGLVGKENGQRDGTDYRYTTSINFHVMNAHRLFEINNRIKFANLIQDPRQYLDHLIEEGVIEVDVFDFKSTPFNKGTRLTASDYLVGNNSLATLDRLKDLRPETTPSINSLEADLDVVANILYRLSPVMVTDGRNLVHIAPK